MSDHKSKGKYGESLAKNFLEKQGYEILEENYRYRKGEIDLIALWKNELLVFIEVKLRKTDHFGNPETFVFPGQQRLIMEAAENYIFDINWKKDVRFDIMAIAQDSGELWHIEDAFF